MKRWSGWAGVVFLCAFVLGAAANHVAAQTVTAVPTLDLKQLMGVWYEIAQYPVKPKKQCGGQAKVLFALNDKPRSFQMGTFCRLSNGHAGEHDATGSMDKQGDGRLKLRRLVLLSTKYWVLAMSPEGEWVLTGDPKRKTLYILSRRTTLEPDVLTEIQGKASAEGFDPGKLVTLSQLP